MFRQIALAALIGLPLAAAVHVPSAEAHGVSYVSVRVAPPPPRHERVVVRRGHVWVPGHWNWTGHRHVWVAGYSTPARHGQHYRAGYWERRGPTWHWHAGRWGR